MKDPSLVELDLTALDDLEFEVSKGRYIYNFWPNDIRSVIHCVHSTLQTIESEYILSSAWKTESHHFQQVLSSFNCQFVTKLDLAVLEVMNKPITCYNKVGQARTTSRKP